MTTLPPRPAEYEDPWWPKRDAWDAAVEAAIEGGGAGGGVGVTISGTAPAAGFWYDTSSAIPNVNPTVILSPLAATLLQVTASWTGSDVDGNIPLTYSVNWGDGATTPSATSPAVHTYAATGVYTVTVTATDTAGGVGTDSEGISVSNAAPSDYPTMVLADTPGLYLRLSETTGTVAQDATANNRDGTYLGSFTLNQGSLLGNGTGSSVFIDDSANGNITVPYVGSLMSTAQMTVECRIRTASSVTTMYVAGRWGGAYAWLLQVSGGYLKIQVRTGGAVTDHTATTAQLVANTNYTLGMTFSDTTHLLCGYVNGVKVISDTVSGPIDAALGEALVLGAAAVGAFSDVRMAEFSWMDAVLSDSRMAARHTAAITA